MRYAKIKYNDTVNCDGGIALSLWTQGCPHRCYNCFNPETWSYEGGELASPALIENIIKGLNKNGIQRNFSILGGDPLCPESRDGVLEIIRKVREAYPNIKIMIWTGYILEDIINNESISQILELIDVLIDGPYIESQRNISLKLRGSENQRILYKGIDF